MQIIFHGHSFVEILTGEGSILIDPFINGNPACSSTVDEFLSKKIRAIIVTHGHDDHIGSTVELAQAQPDAVVITSYELGKYFTNQHDLTNVSTHGTGGGVQYDGFHVKLFQARHGGGITSFEHGYTTVAAGVIITIDGKTIYHAGDTGLFGDMKLLNELYAIDVAFLPIGDRYTMGPDDAAIAASWIKPKILVPIHYNTRDKIAVDTDYFVQQVAQYAADVQVQVLQGGNHLLPPKPMMNKTYTTKMIATGSRSPHTTRKLYETEHYPYRDSVYMVQAFCFAANKLVLAREHNRDYGMLGGHIEKDETREQCLQREVREEGGFLIDHYHLIGMIEIQNAQPRPKTTGGYYAPVGYAPYFLCTTEQPRQPFTCPEVTDVRSFALAELDYFVEPNRTIFERAFEQYDKHKQIL